MFKIRGHFIKQEPYFNNLMQLTFSTECGDLDIMVPQDDYKQYFVTDTEPKMGSYWILRLFQKNYADLGGVMLFRFGTAEQIADAPAAPAPTEKIEEKPMTPASAEKIEESPAAESEAKSAMPSEESLPADSDDTDTAEDEMPAASSDAESNETTDAKKAEEAPAEQPIKLASVNKEASTTDTSLIDDYDPAKEFRNDDDDEDDDDDFITDEVQNVDGFNWDFQEKQPDESADVVEAKTVGTGDDVAEKFAEHEAEKTASEQAAENDPTDLAGKWSEDAADDDEWSDDGEADSDEEDDDDNENLW